METFSGERPDNLSIQALTFRSQVKLDCNSFPVGKRELTIRDSPAAGVTPFLVNRSEAFATKLALRGHCRLRMRCHQLFDEVDQSETVRDLRNDELRRANGCADERRAGPRDSVHRWVTPAPDVTLQYAERHELVKAAVTTPPSGKESACSLLRGYHSVAANPEQEFEIARCELPANAFWSDSSGHRTSND
jgi:hypothetical protein